MADESHLEILKQGVEAWNSWRSEHSEVKLDLTEAALSHAYLHHANLSRTDLSNATLFKTDLSNADLSNATLSHATLSHTDLSNAILSGANLSNADLSNATLSGANLSNANLSNANLSNATLSGVKLSHANLSHANLPNAYLHGAKITHANLSNANLSNAYLRGVNLFDANLSHTNLFSAYLHNANLFSADLSNANLSHTNLSGADLSNANLFSADLSNATLSHANLSSADLTGASLRDADLMRAILVDTSIEGAIFTGCPIYGISVWNLRGRPKEQKDLIISRHNEPAITVDDLLVAQFIYLLINYPELDKVIDTITSKVVLILGRFTDERKKVLDAIRDKLREYDLVPVMFDFARPESQDYLGPVLTIGNMARFIIADFTDAQMVIEEAPNVVNSCNKPLIPLLQESWQEPLPLLNLRVTKRDYVLDTHRYRDADGLLASLRKNVVEPASRRAEELAAFRRDVLGPVDEAVDEKWKQTQK